MLEALEEVAMVVDVSTAVVDVVSWLLLATVVLFNVEEPIVDALSELLMLLKLLVTTSVVVVNVVLSISEVLGVISVVELATDVILLLISWLEVVALSEDMVVLSTEVELLDIGFVVDS